MPQICHHAGAEYGGLRMKIDGEKKWRKYVGVGF